MRRPQLRVPTMKGAARFVGYGAWFFVAFIIGVYLTFPLDEMKGMIIAQAEDQLGKGKQGAYGHDPKVDVGSLSLSGFGVRAKRVQVQLASREPEPGALIELDTMKIGLRPWSLVTKAKTITFDADLYGGSVGGVISVDDKGIVHDADIEVDEVDLSRMTMIIEKLGLPVTGIIDADINLELGPTPEKDGEGDIKLTLSKLGTQPGKLKPVMGFEIPFGIDAGTLTAEIPVKQGKGSLNGVRLDGKDLQAELMGDILFKGKLMASRLDIDGWFQLTPAFVEREKIQPLLDLAGQTLSRAKDEEGHYWFGLKGALQNPAPTLARDGGRRAKQRAGKGAATGKEPPVAKEPGDTDG